MNLPQLPADKANHFIYGAMVATAVRPVGQFFGFDPAASAVAGSLAAGLAKEAADWFSNRRAARRGEVRTHGVEWGDVLATAAGGLPVALAVGF